MPNHVKHIMSFDGNTEQVTALLNFIRSTDDNQFDFDTIIPMPKELAGTQTHSTPNNALITKYGFSDWYKWRLACWGTKWGAYDVTLKDDGLHFQTAWSTAPAIFARLSKMFPKLTINIDYADEDIGHNYGRLSYLNGIMAKEVIEDPVKFACHTWEHDHDEYLEAMQSC